jgi:hypothetical protein
VARDRDMSSTSGPLCSSRSAAVDVVAVEFNRPEASPEDVLPEFSAK